MVCFASIFGKLKALETRMKSGFSASMIGGLADWFAVAALFRKPLDISGKFFRAEIIPKKREYIFHRLVDMVGNC